MSTNLNAFWNDGLPLPSYLPLLYYFSRRPITIGEFYACAIENGSGNLNTASTYPVVQTQEERARVFMTSIEAIASHSFVVGTDWFQSYDEPPFGREDGENMNFGMVFFLSLCVCVCVLLSVRYLQYSYVYVRACTWKRYYRSGCDHYKKFLTRRFNWPHHRFFPWLFTSVCVYVCVFVLIITPAAVYVAT